MREELCASVGPDPAYEMATFLAKELINKNQNPLFQRRVLIELTKIILHEAEAQYKNLNTERECLIEKIGELGSCLENLHSMIESKKL